MVQLDTLLVTYFAILISSCPVHDTHFPVVCQFYRGDTSGRHVTESIHVSAGQMLYEDRYLHLHQMSVLTLCGFKCL